MDRFRRAMGLSVAALGLTSTLAAWAADAARGDALYHDASVGRYGCHGADPRRDEKSAVDLGIAWQNIRDAIDFKVPDMAFLSRLAPICWARAGCRRASARSAS